MRVKYASFLVSLLFLLGAVPAVSAPPSATPSTAAALSISVVPPKLPADNTTYPALVVSLTDKAGLPTIAVNDTLVYLSSSLESVGKVQSAVTIGLGKNYALANFTTTKTPGVTRITASATGLQSVFADVATLVARGYPNHLTITAVPDIVSARRSNTGSLILELRDDAGLPAKAVLDTTVNLYSSNKHILNVTGPSTTIKAGQFLRLINYTTGVVPGSALVTASISGYGPGSTAVTVLGLPPLSLKLFPQPSEMVTCGSPAVQSCTGRLVIAITDVKGNPVPAPGEITVFIRSSDISRIAVPKDQVKIGAGDISATAAYTTTQLNGTAKITVSSPSLESDFATITTNNLPLNPKTKAPMGPSGVKLYVGPAAVLANHESYSSVVASLVNGNTAVVNSTGPTNVVLTSSLSAVGDITQVFLTIPQGQNFAATVFTSTFQVGVTTLTASAHNLLPDQNKLSTFGPIPAKIVLRTISSTLPADGSAHSALEIGLQDSFGAPVPAPTYLPVNLSSSQNGVAKVFPTGIKVGQSFAITNVTTGVIPGTANVTAITKLSSGYSVSSALLDTVVPAPSAIGAFVSAPKGIFDKAHNPFLVVQLEDAASNPARAREVTIITITSSNTTVLDKTLQILIRPGVDFLKVPMQPRVSGTTTLTLSSPGLTSATAVLTLIPQPYTVQISPFANIFANQTASITVSAQLLGKGVKGVQVKWNTSSGVLSSINSSTSAAGTSAVVLTPSGPGAVTIVATLRHPALGTVNATSTVIVLAVPIRERPSILQQLVSYPYLYGLIGGAAGAVIALLFVLRRRRSKAGEADEDAGFDLAVSAFPLRNPW